MKRFAFAAALAIAGLVATEAQAQVQFAELTSLTSTGADPATQPFSYSVSGGNTTIGIIPTATGSFDVLNETIVNGGASGEVDITVSSLMFMSSNSTTTIGEQVTGFSGELTLTSSSGGTFTATINNDSGLFTYVGTGVGVFAASDVSYSGTGDLALGSPLFLEGFSLSFAALTEDEFTTGSGNMGGNGVFNAAIPEPASLAMAGFGLLALPAAAAVARRRRAKA